MNNHPNRASRASPLSSTVKAAREAAGLTPEQAGAMIHERGRRWTDFESGTARMHPAAWELFCLKTADSAGLRQRLHAFVTPGRRGEGDYIAMAPRPAETWYDRDTGCAVTIDEVREGIVYAHGCRTSVSITLDHWAEFYQRDPIAV